MIDPISVGQTKEYVLKNDKVNPTIWLIGAIDSITKAKIISGFGKVEIQDNKPVYIQGEMNLALNNFAIVKYGLKGFKNFILDGNPIEFKTIKEKVFNAEIDAVPDEILKMIPLYAIAELSDVIWGENQVSKETIKN
jgi:hypothetical protein